MAAGARPPLPAVVVAGVDVSVGADVSVDVGRDVGVVVAYADLEERVGVGVDDDDDDGGAVDGLGGGTDLVFAEVVEAGDAAGDDGADAAEDVDDAAVDAVILP